MGDQRDSQLIMDYGSCTHLGGKKENQDYFGALMDEAADKHCFVIADGLGGYRGGGNAAKLAVESILKSFAALPEENPGGWLHSTLQEAHSLIKRMRKDDASLGSMKTTCAVMVMIRGTAYWASVGDSRVYVIRNGAVLHRSKDHSVVQLLLDMGEIKPDEVRGHPDRNRILRVLGMEEDMRPSVQSEGLLLCRGDCVLLCTDGFWGDLEDSAIVDHIATHSHMPAQGILESLFDRIIAAFGESMLMERHDNLSAQLIVVK